MSLGMCGNGVERFLGDPDPWDQGPIPRLLGMYKTTYGLSHQDSLKR